MDYLDPEDDYWRRQMLRVRALRREGAAPSFGWWDAIPGDPKSKETYFYFLKLWRAIAGNGTRVFVEARLEGLWRNDPKPLVQSIFVNSSIYLLAANLGPDPLKLFPGFSLWDLETESQMAKGEMMALSANDLKFFRLLRQPPVRKGGGSAAGSTVPGERF